MEYCRSLKFEQEPNYKQCIGLFENCLSRHNYDPKIMDYTWKQNRLSKDKESLKAQMLGVIKKKKPNEKETPGQAGTAQPSQVPGASGTNGTASK
jgi:hypothetical protein